MDALLVDDEFRRFLFGRMKKDVPHYLEKSEVDYALHTGKYLAKASRMDEDGDERVTIVRLYKAAYDRYKTEVARIEQERSQREAQQENRDTEPMTPEQLDERRRIVADLKRRNKLNKLWILVS